jgi:hypothetical protein
MVAILAIPISIPALRKEVLSSCPIKEEIPVMEPTNETRKKLNGSVEKKETRIMVPKDPAKARRGLKNTEKSTPLSATGREYSKEERGMEGKPA